MIAFIKALYLTLLCSIKLQLKYTKQREVTLPNPAILATSQNVLIRGVTPRFALENTMYIGTIGTF